MLAQKTPSDWSKFFDSQSEASIQWSLMLTPLTTKQNTPCERVWKTVPENGVFSCVPFYLRALLGVLKDVYSMDNVMLDTTMQKNREPKECII